MCKLCGNLCRSWRNMYNFKVIHAHIHILTLDRKHVCEEPNFLCGWQNSVGKGPR